MFIEVKFRKGTANQHTTFVGGNTEVTVDTTHNTLRVHDGVTPGGFRLAKVEDFSSLTSHLIPSANVTYDLGSPERAWRDLYLSGNTIFIGDKSISSDTGKIAFTDKATGDLIPVEAKELKLGVGNTATTLKTREDGKITAVDQNTDEELQTTFSDVSITNLVLENVLGPEYGGTGLDSFTENGVMFASSSSSLDFITGTSGQILQIDDKGVPTFDKLDGGEF